MKILVMGGSQFNGLALVKALVHRGHQVVVLNRGQSRARLPAQVERRYADRTHPEALNQALAGLEVDAVIDLSAYQLGDVQWMVERFRGRIRHYLFASSSIVYGRSRTLPITEHHPLERGVIQSDYGQGKLACEDYLIEQHRRHGFPATIGVLSMVFGPNNILPDREQRMFARMLQRRPVLIPGDGTTLGQITHVEDCAEAFIAMLDKPTTFGKRYNIVGNDYYSDEGYVDTFAAVTGMDVPKVFIPATLMDGLWSGEIKLEIPDVEARIDNRANERDRALLALFNLTKLIQRAGFNIHRWNDNVLFSNEQLKRDTGWQPRFDFAGAVEHTFEWYQHAPEAVHDFDFRFEDELLQRIETMR